MTNQPPTSKTTASRRPQSPIKVIRSGAIAASIWRRQTSTGFEYLDFSLSRSWKLKNGEREGYSQNFFDSNADALADVIRQARDFIAGHSAAVADQQTTPPRGGPRVTPPSSESVDRA
ncbi:MAG: hypothetical protein GXY83_01200 [Rhodopirellula sp.]|nr:hypothetical protein [Rhodopirellula sp.]